MLLHQNQDQKLTYLFRLTLMILTSTVEFANIHIEVKVIIENTSREYTKSICRYYRKDQYMTPI
jgi:hypothetical protein